MKTPLSDTESTDVNQFVNVILRILGYMCTEEGVDEAQEFMVKMVKRTCAFRKKEIKAGNKNENTGN